MNNSHISIILASACSCAQEYVDKEEAGGIDKLDRENLLRCASHQASCLLAQATRRGKEVGVVPSDVILKELTAHPSKTSEQWLLLLNTIVAEELGGWVDELPAPQTKRTLYLSMPDPPHVRDLPLKLQLMQGDAWTTDMEQAMRFAMNGVRVARRDRHIDTGEISETELSSDQLGVAITRRMEMRGDARDNRPGELRHIVDDGHLTELDVDVVYTEVDLKGQPTGRTLTKLAGNRPTNYREALEMIRDLVGGESDDPDRDLARMCDIASCALRGESLPKYEDE